MRGVLAKSEFGVEGGGLVFDSFIVVFPRAGILRDGDTTLRLPVKSFEKKEPERCLALVAPSGKGSSARFIVTTLPFPDD